jgi:hypothetical protein
MTFDAVEFLRLASCRIALPVSLVQCDEMSLILQQNLLVNSSRNWDTFTSPIRLVLGADSTSVHHVLKSMYKDDHSLSAHFDISSRVELS